MFNRWSPIHQMVIVLPLAIVLGSFLTDQIIGLVAPSDLAGVVSPFGQIIVGLAIYTAGVKLMENSWPSQLRIRGLSELFGGLLLGGLACFGIVAVLFSQHLVQATLSDGGIGVLHNLLQAGLVVGILEEVIFRGIILCRLQPILGTREAIGVVSLAFAATHLFNPSLSVLGLIGVMVGGGLFLSLLFIHTKSIWLVIGFHVAWNTVQGPIFGSSISGAATGASWLHWESTSSVLLSGGKFGLEASLITIAVFLVASLVLWGLIKQKSSGEPLAMGAMSSFGSADPELARPTILDSFLIDPSEYDDETHELSSVGLADHPDGQSTAQTEWDKSAGPDLVETAESLSEPDTDADRQSVESSAKESQIGDQPSTGGTTSDLTDHLAEVSSGAQGQVTTEPEQTGEMISESDSASSEHDSSAIEIGRKPGRPYLRILGQVRLEGVQRSRKRKSSRGELDMLAYLFLHPEARGKEIDQALWPKKVSAKQSTPRIPIAAALRMMLGNSEDGSPRLAPRSYQLHDLDSDWQQFQSLTAESASQDQLEAALSLVRGEPLAGLTGGWAHQQRKEIQQAIKEARAKIKPVSEKH